MPHGKEESGCEDGRVKRKAAVKAAGEREKRPRRRQEKEKSGCEGSRGKRKAAAEAAGEREKRL